MVRCGPPTTYTKDLTMSALKSVFESRIAAQTELRSFYDGVKDLSNLSAEDVAKEARLADTVKDLQTREANLVDLEAQNKAADEAYRDSGAKTEERKAEGTPSDNDRLRTMGSMDPSESRSAKFEMRDDTPLTAGTATDGAELVPTTLWGSLSESLRESATIMNTEATIITTVGGGDLVLPRVTSYSVATIIGEAAAIDRDAPQFDTLTLGAYKYAFTLDISRELIQDKGFDISGFIASNGMSALARGTGAHFVAGDGSGKPNGVVTAATTGVTAASTTAITADEVIDLYHSVISGYRGIGSFLMSDDALLAIRKLKSNDTQYLWQPGLAAGVPDTLLGRPVFTDEAVVAPGAAVDSVLFGNLKGYTARFVGGVDVAVSEHVNFNTDLLTWRFIVRADGDLVDASAVRVLTQAAA